MPSRWPVAGRDIHPDTRIVKARQSEKGAEGMPPRRTSANICPLNDVPLAERPERGKRKQVSVGFSLAARERAEIKRRVCAYAYKSHLVVYVIDGHDVMIVRIRHAHEDWMDKTI